MSTGAVMHLSSLELHRLAVKAVRDCLEAGCSLDVIQLYYYGFPIDVFKRSEDWSDTLTRLEINTDVSGGTTISSTKQTKYAADNFTNFVRLAFKEGANPLNVAAYSTSLRDGFSFKKNKAYQWTENTEILKEMVRAIAAQKPGTVYVPDKPDMSGVQIIHARVLLEQSACRFLLDLTDRTAPTTRILQQGCLYTDLDVLFAQRYSSTAMKPLMTPSLSMLRGIDAVLAETSGYQLRRYLETLHGITIPPPVFNITHEIHLAFIERVTQMRGYLIKYYLPALQTGIVRNDSALTDIWKPENTRGLLPSYIWHNHGLDEEDDPHTIPLLLEQLQSLGYLSRAGRMIQKFGKRATTKAQVYSALMMRVVAYLHDNPGVKIGDDFWELPAFAGVDVDGKTYIKNTFANYETASAKTKPSTTLLDAILNTTIDKLNRGGRLLSSYTQTELKDVIHLPLFDDIDDPNLKDLFYTTTLNYLEECTTTVNDGLFYGEDISGHTVNRIQQAKTLGVMLGKEQIPTLTLALFHGKLLTGVLYPSVTEPHLKQMIAHAFAEALENGVNQHKLATPFAPTEDERICLVKFASGSTALTYTAIQGVLFPTGCPAEEEHSTVARVLCSCALVRRMRIDEKNQTRRKVSSKGAPERIQKADSFTPAQTKALKTQITDDIQHERTLYAKRKEYFDNRTDDIIMMRAGFYSALRKLWKKTKKEMSDNVKRILKNKLLRDVSILATLVHSPAQSLKYTRASIDYAHAIIDAMAPNALPVYAAIKSKYHRDIAREMLASSYVQRQAEVNTEYATYKATIDYAIAWFRYTGTPPDKLHDTMLLFNPLGMTIPDELRALQKDAVAAETIIWHVQNVLIPGQAPAVAPEENDKNDIAILRMLQSKFPGTIQMHVEKLWELPEVHRKWFDEKGVVFNFTDKTPSSKMELLLQAVYPYYPAFEEHLGILKDAIGQKNPVPEKDIHKALGHILTKENKIPKKDIGRGLLSPLIHNPLLPALRLLMQELQNQGYLTRDSREPQYVKQHMKQAKKLAYKIAIENIDRRVPGFHTGASLTGVPQDYLHDVTDILQKTGRLDSNGRIKTPRITMLPAATQEEILLPIIHQYAQQKAAKYPTIGVSATPVIDDALLKTYDAEEREAVCAFLNALWDTHYADGTIKLLMKYDLEHERMMRHQEDLADPTYTVRWQNVKRNIDRLHPIVQPIAQLHYNRMKEANDSSLIGTTELMPDEEIGTVVCTPTLVIATVEHLVATNASKVALLSEVKCRNWNSIVDFMKMLIPHTYTYLTMPSDPISAHAEFQKTDYLNAATGRLQYLAKKKRQPDSIVHFLYGNKPVPITTTERALLRFDATKTLVKWTDNSTPPNDEWYASLPSLSRLPTEKRASGREAIQEMWEEMKTMGNEQISFSGIDAIPPTAVCMRVIEHVLDLEIADWKLQAGQKYTRDTLEAAIKKDLDCDFSPLQCDFDRLKKAKYIKEGCIHLPEKRVRSPADT